MKISILLPCYNGEKWLDRAISSVLNQSYQNFELIAVDDGSTDKTYEILNKYASNDSRIRVFKKQNTGASDTLNFAISQAVGTWGARIDQDDEWMADKLSRQVQFLEEYKEVILLGTGFTEINEVGSHGKTFIYPADNRALVSRLKKLQGYFPHSSVMYRLDIVKDLGGYNTRLDKADDWWLWCQMAHKGKMASLPSPLIYVRKHSMQRSHELGGELQMLHAVLGSTCFFIKESLNIDPSVDFDDKEWEIFVNCVNSFLVEKNYYLQRKYWIKCRDEFYGNPNRVNALINFLKALIFSAHTFPLLKHKFLGSKIPFLVSKHWIRTQIAV